MITKRALNASLNRLGKTSQEIAESLRQLKITGRQMDSAKCPLAVYLRTEFPDESVEVNDAGIEVNGAFVVRKGAGDFVDDFDGGRYPDLVAAKPVKKAAKKKKAK